LSGAFFGITGAVNGSTANLYLTTGDGGAANNKLQLLTDTAAFNAAITGTPTDLGGLAGTNFAYQGVAFAPVPVPEPSLVLSVCAAFGAAGVGVRRLSGRTSTS
jgi:hypothetical protein